MASAVSSPELIGRASELRALQAAMSRAAQGAPEIVILAGEAGIGKTRLIAEFAERARADGTVVLKGGCLDIGAGGMPYAPLTEALRGFFRGLPAARVARLLGSATDEVGRLLPGIGRVGPLATARGTGTAVTNGETPAAAAAATEAADARSGLDQARLFGLVLGLLGDLAAEAPTALVFEDLHWVDRSTRDLVTFLARNLDDERFLLVLSVRTDDLAVGHPVAGWLGGLERDARTSRVDLTRLSRDDVARQVDALTGHPADEPFVDRIHARSEGNPFFVEELVAADQRGGGGPLPRTLTETLAGQVAALSDASRGVLGIVALAGRPIPEQLIAAVADRPTATMHEPIRAAVAAGVLAPEAPTGALRLRHALLGEVVAAELLPAERRALYERFATVLAGAPELAEPSPAGAAAELAHHWAAADRPLEAFRASIAAAEAAERVYAFAAAARHYEVALGLQPRLDTTDAATATGMPDPIELRRRAARVADDAGDPERAIAWLREALDLLDPAKDPVAAGILHSRLGYNLWVAERNEEAHLEHQAAVRLVPAQPPTAERAQVLLGLGGWLMGAGRYGESRQACEEAVDCAVAAGALAEEGRARSNLGSDLVSLGEVAAGIRELEQARRIGAETGRVDTLLPASANLAYQLVVADRFDDAVAAARAGAEEARAQGLERRFGPHFRAVAIDALFRAGRWPEAEAAARTSTERRRGGLGSTYRDAAAARLLGALGELAAAHERLDEAARLGAGEIDADVGAYVQLVAAELALDAGELGSASAAVEAGFAHLEESDDTVLVGPLSAAGLRAAADRAERARARRRPLDVEAAEAAGARARQRADAIWSVTPPAGGSAIATQLTCEAEASRLAGTSEPAAWGATADAWAAIPMPYPTAYARFRAAEASLLAGARAEAEVALAEAHRTARSLGAVPLLGLIDGLARRARIPLESSAAADPAAPDAAPTAAAATEPGPDTPFAGLGLSVREVEVLALVAAGRTNGQIAKELFISPKTASVHVTHILDKLGVSSRIEAAMLAARAGHVAPELDDSDGDAAGGRQG